MASLIYLGSYFGKSDVMDIYQWESELEYWRGRGYKAIVAKGNTIEGIEAKE